MKRIIISIIAALVYVCLPSTGYEQTLAGSALSAAKQSAAIHGEKPAAPKIDPAASGAPSPSGRSIFDDLDALPPAPSLDEQIAANRRQEAGYRKTHVGYLYYRGLGVLALIGIAVLLFVLIRKIRWGIFKNASCDRGGALRTRLLLHHQHEPPILLHGCSFSAAILL